MVTIHVFRCVGNLRQLGVYLGGKLSPSIWVVRVCALLRKVSWWDYNGVYIQMLPPSWLLILFEGYHMELKKTFYVLVGSRSS